jgi:hypothetical protein
MQHWCRGPDEPLNALGNQAASCRCPRQPCREFGADVLEHGAPDRIGIRSAELHILALEHEHRRFVWSAIDNGQ